MGGSLILSNKNKLKRRFRVILILSFCLLLTILAIFLTNLSKQTVVSKESIKKSMSTFSLKDTSVVVNNLPTLKVELKHSTLLKIYDLVNENKKKKVMRTRKYFSGAIKQNGKTIPIKIRLKGDWTDHLNEWKKWSFRVQVKGDNTYEGMKVFSVQHPKTRNYLYEWAFNNFLREEDILAPRYSFVNLQVNDEQWGIFAIEESFSKELLESLKRRESVIVKYNESAVWDFNAQQISIEDQSRFSDEAKVDTFKAEKNFQKENLLNMFSAAKNKLERLIKKDIPLNEVFDLDSLAKYYAYSDLFLAHHGSFTWHNLRFYYNPITGLLEPIHFDGMAGIEMHGDLVGFGHGMYGYLYGNLEFLEKYYKELKKVSHKSFIERFHQKYDQKILELGAILKKEFLKFEHDIYRVDDVGKVLRFYLNHIDPEFSFRSYYNPDKLTDNGVIPVEITNFRDFPFEVLGFEIKNKTNKWSPVTIVSSEAELYERNNNYVLKGYKKGGKRNVNFQLKIPGRFLINGKVDGIIRAKYRFLGDTTISQVTVDPLRKYIDTGIPQESDIATLTKKYDCISLDKKTLIIHGTCTVDEDIIISSEISVKIDAGTKIKFSPGNAFVIKSSLEINGTKEQPVILTSLVPSKTWGGLFVIKPKGKSLIKFLSISNTSGVKRPGWELSGGSTFYEGHFDIYDSKFSSNQSEDLLNIIRSTFLIMRSEFANTPSDAIDIDFGVGEIHFPVFNKIGNDAMDFSGSKIVIQNATVNDAGDKGVSAGEHSYVRIINSKISSANIGLASKDKSRLKAVNVSVSNSKEYDIAIYQKKPEFGGASVQAEKFVFSKPGKWFVDEGSEGIVNGHKLSITSKKKVEVE